LHRSGGRQTAVLLQQIDVRDSLPSSRYAGFAEVCKERKSAATMLAQEEADRKQIGEPTTYSIRRRFI
jgi:hypothetical protein